MNDTNDTKQTRRCLVNMSINLIYPFQYCAWDYQGIYYLTAEAATLLFVAKKIIEI